MNALDDRQLGFAMGLPMERERRDYLAAAIVRPRRHAIIVALVAGAVAISGTIIGMVKGLPPLEWAAFIMSFLYVSTMGFGAVASPYLKLRSELAHRQGMIDICESEIRRR